MTHVAPPPAGAYTIHDVEERNGLWLPLFSRHNQIQYDWARIALQLFGRGKADYRISAVYAEFENVASPGDPATAPEYDRDEGVEYYTSLSGSRDYLRLPLLSEPTLAVASGYGDYFSGVDDDFNQMTFFAQTSGSAGANGLAFSEAANSVVLGVALVATPVPADRTRDVVFGRAYFATNQQVAKADGHQVGVSWSQIFA